MRSRAWDTEEDLVEVVALEGEASAVVVSVAAASEAVGLEAVAVASVVAEEVSAVVVMEVVGTAEVAMGEAATAEVAMAEVGMVEAAPQVAGLHLPYTRSLSLRPRERRAQSWRQSAVRQTLQAPTWGTPTRLADCPRAFRESSPIRWITAS